MYKPLKFCLTFYSEYNASKLYTHEEYMFLWTILKLILFSNSSGLTLFYEELLGGPIGPISLHLDILWSHR